MRNHKKSLSKHLRRLLPSVGHIIIKKRKTVRVDEYKRKQIQIYKSNKKLLIQENQLATIFLNRLGASEVFSNAFAQSEVEKNIIGTIIETSTQTSMEFVIIVLQKNNDRVLIEGMYFGLVFHFGEQGRRGKGIWILRIRCR